MNPWKSDVLRKQCYPQEKSGIWRIVGITLIVGGALILLFFVPGWAWLAIIAALLIAFGILLIQ